MRLERVMELGKFLFGNGKDPTHLPHMITVLVDSANYPIMAHKGSLKRVSPEEPCHAAIFVCADDITRLQHDLSPEAKERLMRWRQIFLSCCFCFEVATGDDAVYWRAYNLRQLVTAEYGAVRRTAWQMAYELALFKRAKEQETGQTLTKRQVTELYQSNGTTAKKMPSPKTLWEQLGPFTTKSVVCHGWSTAWSPKRQPTTCRAVSIPCPTSASSSTRQTTSACGHGSWNPS